MKTGWRVRGQFPGGGSQETKLCKNSAIIQTSVSNQKGGEEKKKTPTQGDIQTPNAFPNSQILEKKSLSGGWRCKKWVTLGHPT